MGFFTNDRQRAVFDIECYTNYFLLMFMTFKTKKVVYFEMHNDEQPLDLVGIRNILKNWRLVSFNGNHYDIPILSLALTGATNAELKRATDFIITEKHNTFEFRDEFQVYPPDYLDHIDLIEPAPSADDKLKIVGVGLKKYGARMHFETVQDLPIKHSKIITKEDARKLRPYCENDCRTTIALANTIATEIKLREQMSDQYGIDLRSKSDAQVAEAVIKAEVERISGHKIKRPPWGSQPKLPAPFKYTPPDYIKFRTPELQAMLEDVRQAVFRFDPATKKLILPETLEGRIVHVDGMPYKMGIGGLHSMEKSRSIIATLMQRLKDWDVTGYYPKLIINSGMFPKIFGEVFQQVYAFFYYERVKAKRGAETAEESGDAALQKTLEVMSAMFKIFLNGAFGKLGSIWSLLFTPEMLIWTTMTGQLSILMFIEDVVHYGGKVVSANTDGITCLFDKELEGLMKVVVKDWEWETNLETEETNYSAVYSRDVNNYLAVKTNGKTKGIGIFKPPSLRNDPDNWVTKRAVIDFLTKGVPMEDTIRGCTDIRDFISIAQVGGGAEKDGEFLGKIARWYMAVDCPGPITYIINGNKVGGSDGGRPAMVIKEYLDNGTVPDDIDYDWYLQAAHQILDNIGFEERPRTFDGRTGRALARLPGAKNIHAIDLGTYMSACGRYPDSRMDRWVEVDAIPEGHRFCPKCRKAEEL